MEKNIPNRRVIEFPKDEMLDLRPGADNKGGFSLMEVLLVLAIMSIFAGLGFSGARGIRGWSAKAESLALFSELENACRLYRMDHGEWPSLSNLGEVALNQSISLKKSIAPYMETRLSDSVLMDGSGNQDLYMVLDSDGDHWIESRDFEALGEGERPDKIWLRVAIYSLNEVGGLAFSNW